MMICMTRIECLTPNFLAGLPNNECLTGKSWFQLIREAYEAKLPHYILAAARGGDDAKAPYEVYDGAEFFQRNIKTSPWFNMAYQKVHYLAIELIEEKNRGLAAYIVKNSKDPIAIAPFLEVSADIEELMPLYIPASDTAAQREQTLKRARFAQSKLVQTGVGLNPNLEPSYYRWICEAAELGDEQCRLILIILKITLNNEDRQSEVIEKHPCGTQSS